MIIKLTKKKKHSYFVFASLIFGPFKILKEVCSLLHTASIMKNYHIDEALCKF